MDKNRLWTIGLAAAIAVVALVGWFLGISPIVEQTSAAKIQQQSLVVNNDSSQARVAALKKQFENIGTLEAQRDELSKSIPTGASIASFLREVNELTTANGVTLGNAAVSAAQSYEAPVAATATTTTDTSTASASPSPSPSASTSSTDASATTTAAPAAGSALILVPVTITVSGKYDNVLAFIGGIQAGERLYLVKTVSIRASTAIEGNFDGSITGVVYALPTS